jgi:hypothetical protein
MRVEPASPASTCGGAGYCRKIEKGLLFLVSGSPGERKRAIFWKMYYT